MPLQSVRLEPAAVRPPPEVRRFLREARRRIGHFARAQHVPAFAACDFGRVYAALHALEGSGLLTGRWFCEWGSGFGVVSCLAAMLGFEAWGIEVEGGLVEAARRLADDFDLAPEFVWGSFIPQDEEARLGEDREFAWLDTAARSGHEAMGMGPDEFDLVFAYPWPDEEGLVADLFEGGARTGAMLLTYNPEGDVRLWRKVAPPK